MTNSTPGRLASRRGGGRRSFLRAMALLAAAAFACDVDALAFAPSPLSSSLLRPSSPFGCPAAIATFSSSSSFSIATVQRMSVAGAEEEEENTKPHSKCWNPPLRRIVGAVSALGALETAYLSYDKIWGGGVGTSALCGASAEAAGGCASVLNGPYADLHVMGGGTSIPLSALGFASYAVVMILALGPLFPFNGSSETADSQDVVDRQGEDMDVTNRLILLGMTTIMANFSALLMGLLFNVLHASCPFCVVSACLSLSLGALTWFGGALPGSNRDRAASLGLGGFAMSTAAAVALFLGAVPDPMGTTNDMNPASGFTSVVVANAATRQQQKDLPPPPITTHSTERTLKIAADLQELNSRMYGAYWCSHCYEQKESLGMEAMRRVPYVECSREGLNSQRDLCQEKDVPGYPTWEVAGKLYPGEMELDELESIVKESRERVARESAQL